MGNTNSKIEDILTSAQVALSNMQNDAELQVALATYGCTGERLADGQVLRDRALTLHQQQGLAYGELTSASSALTMAQAQAKTDYNYYVKLARVAFADNPGALRKLDVTGTRKLTRAGWMIQVEDFYANALADDAILSTLNRLDVTREKLEAGKQQIVAVGACAAARHSHKGAAQTATKLSNEAIAALRVWMGEFREIARLALKNQPTSLKKLGVPAR